jgi:hypothetical protein
LPPATICTWPYEVMYGEDVRRNDSTGQKYDNDRRFENVKAYFSQIEEGKSLLFYYANYSNPYSDEDNNRYILIGIGRLKKKGKFHCYNNVSDRIKQRYANGLVWQYPLTSSWPEEGIRLPFHVYKDKPEIFEKLAITPDNPNVFKYATRILSDDDALSVIEKFITVVNYLKETGDETENWDERLNCLLELAYVLSIHKAQGSEFERVYLILPNGDRRLLSMELLYTGITRASERLTIFAEQDISCFTRLAAIGKSNLRKINSSIFEFSPLPDEIIYPSLCNWYEESKKNSTLSKYYVRSKSEMNIANILSLRDIPFEYEKPLFAKDGTMYLPDFTITYKGRTYYWEHIGRLDLPEYEKHWKEKEEWYHNFFPDQLIKTYESNNQTKDIENIINEKLSGSI